MGRRGWVPPCLRCLDRLVPNLISIRSGLDAHTGKGLGPVRGPQKVALFSQAGLVVLEGALQECLRPHKILSTARALVIDAEENISTNPSSGFY